MQFNLYTFSFRHLIINHNNKRSAAKSISRHVFILLPRPVSYQRFRRGKLISSKHNTGIRTHFKMAKLGVLTLLLLANFALLGDASSDQIVVKAVVEVSF